MRHCLQTVCSCLPGPQGCTVCKAVCSGDWLLASQSCTQKSAGSSDDQSDVWASSGPGLPAHAMVSVAPGFRKDFCSSEGQQLVMSLSHRLPPFTPAHLQASAEMGGFQRPPPHQQPFAPSPGVAATSMSRSGSHSTTGSRQASIASAVGPSIGAAGPSRGPSRGPSLEEQGSRQFSFRPVLPEGPPDGWTEAGPERSTAERMGSSALRAPAPGEEAALAGAGSRAAGQGGGEYMSPFEAASQVGTLCCAQGPPLSQAPAADRVSYCWQCQSSNALGQGGKEYVSSFQPASQVAACTAVCGRLRGLCPCNCIEEAELDSAGSKATGQSFKEYVSCCCEAADLGHNQLLVCPHTGGTS